MSIIGGYRQVGVPAVLPLQNSYPIDYALVTQSGRARKMRSKSTLDKKREAAFSLEIESRGQDRETRIIEVFGIDNKLFVFKEDRVFHVQTADKIDPLRQYPETKGSTTQVWEIGTSHPIVARTIIQAKNLVESVIFKEGISKDEILNRYLSFFKELVACYFIYDKLVSSFFVNVEQAEEALKLSSGKDFVGDLPQIADLEEKSRSFFLTAKKAITELANFSDLFFPNKPKSQNFKGLSKWLLNNLGSEHDLSRMVNDDREWLEVLWEIRNAIEHPGRGAYNFEVRNIEMGPDCKFYPPRWKYTIPQKSQNYYSALLQDMESSVNNMLNFGEEFLVLCIKEGWDDRFPFMIYKISEAELDPKCPIQYGIGINRIPT